MLGRKYETAAILTIEGAEFSYYECGIALIVTDGKFVEIVKEEK